MTKILIGAVSPDFEEKSKNKRIFGRNWKQLVSSQWDKIFIFPSKMSFRKSCMYNNIVVIKQSSNIEFLDQKSSATPTSINM